MKKILLAEDDFDFGTALTRYLTLNKFDVRWAKNGAEGLEMFRQEKFDICILDVMMPKTDGFTLAKKITAIHPDTPFLFLTARKIKEDRVKGLKLGADDYITKPFVVEELLLRINNILKRTGKQTPFEQQIEGDSEIAIGKYTFNPKSFELRFESFVYKLTEKEAQLIYFLFSQKNQVIKRDDILIKFWNSNDFFSGRSMDVFISRIRKLFKEDENISIRSVRGIGLEFNLK